jgi:hypothetical protein
MKTETEKFLGIKLNDKILNIPTAYNQISDSYRNNLILEVITQVEKVYGKNASDNKQKCISFVLANFAHICTSDEVSNIKSSTPSRLWL